MNQTITYYNQHAQSFAAQTLPVDFEVMQQRFISKLPSAAWILDFGCGAGRDAKYFLDHKYKVEAIDASEELCKIAGSYTGIPVKQMLFQELNEHDRYDGIWACSSILHLQKKELPDVIRKMLQAVKNNGIIYTSFKYGTFEGERNGRYFTDLTEETFAMLLHDIPNVEIEEQWVTTDVRPERRDEKWLNLILRKIALPTRKISL